MSFISPKLVKLSLLHKSNPLFCPPCRPSSPRRPHIIIFPPISDPLLVPHLISKQPFLPPTSHSNNKYITSTSHHITQCLYPPTPPSLVPIHSIPHQHVYPFSKPFVHNTQHISIFTVFLAVSRISISCSLHNLTTHPLIYIDLLSTQHSSCLHCSHFEFESSTVIAKPSKP